MARYAICDKCGKLYEYKPQIKYEGGVSHTTAKCDNCGYIKTTSKNHIHYGNDGKS